jgi:hypothetical protein
MTKYQLNEWAAIQQYKLNEWAAVQQYKLKAIPRDVPYIVLKLLFLNHEKKFLLKENNMKK